MPPSAARSRPSRVAVRASEGALLRARKGRHRLIAAQGRAVHLDELACELPAVVLEIEDAPRELALARARGARDQQRRPATNGHPLDPLDELR